MASKDPPSSKPPGSPPQGPPVLNKKADIFTDSVITIDPQTKERMQQAAPEVSQGAWRERAFRPRGTLPKEEVLAGLQAGIQFAATLKEPVEHVCASLKAEWLPFVQQALEQAGGDGLDGYLRSLFGARREAKDPLFADLLAAYARLNQVPTTEALFAEAEQVVARVRAVLEAEQKPRLSLKALEKELEGRLNVDELLAIIGCSDRELADRLTHVKSTTERVRKEIRDGIPGAQPTGLLWNFTRFRAERLLIEAEQRRRAEK